MLERTNKSLMNMSIANIWSISTSLTQLPEQGKNVDDGCFYHNSLFTPSFHTDITFES